MRLSVYVPCYNGAPWLAECLDALLAQTQPVEELLVVDDGSTDASPAIARQYAPRVRLVQHPRNLGLAVARNTALTTAVGDVVAAVDADVRVTPTWLARLLDAFQSPRVVAVGGRLLEAHQERLPDRWRAIHMAQHAGDLPLVNPPVLPGANVAVRRDVVRRLGGYDESLRTNYEDADIQHRLLAGGFLCRYEPGALAYHLRTDTAGTVLRTYWGWLRPPAERQGAFLDAAGLEGKLAANAGFARRALWRDMADGRADLTYLSLLVLLAFPAADLAHAARRATERGEGGAAATYSQGAAHWVAGAPATLATRSPRLAAHLAADLTAVAWWDAPARPEAVAPVATGSLARSLEAVRGVVESLPRAWWPGIELARHGLATEEGWPQVSALRAQGAGLRARFPKGPAAPPRPAGTDEVAEAARWLAGAAGGDALAVYLHGAHGRGEALTWAPLELLVLVRRSPPAPLLERWRRGLTRRAGGCAVRLEGIEAHRLGWLRPSLLQQSLLAGAVTLWGDPAGLRAIPPRPPETLDPLWPYKRGAGLARPRPAGGSGPSGIAIGRAAVARGRRGGC